MHHEDFNHLIPTKTRHGSEEERNFHVKIKLNCMIRRYCNTPLLPATNQLCENHKFKQTKTSKFLIKNPSLLAEPLFIPNQNYNPKSHLKSRGQKLGKNLDASS